jgi:hypothetical protein
MGLASALLPYAEAQGGTVLYVSAEEGAGRTTAERAQRLGAVDDHLLISDFRSFGALFNAIEKHNARAVVLDSASVIGSAQSKRAAHLMETLRKVGVAGIIVSHALKGGEGYKGNSAIGHACYAEVHCYPDPDEDTGEVRHLATAEKNRYGPTVGDVTKIPMTEEEILPLTDEALQHSIRENFGSQPRQNPDCSAPQSEQCRAIFAELDEEGQTIRARSENDSSDTPSANGGENQGGSQGGGPHEAGNESSSQSQASEGSQNSPIDRLESLLNEAIT